MNPRYAEVATRAGHRCEYCHAPEAIFNFPFEVEHVVSAHRNGPDEATNWALACRSCNVFKGDALEALDPETSEPTRLFHPRRDMWNEPFTVELEDGDILGTTPVGRATVIKLRMNASVQTEARRQWMRIGLFP